MNSRRIRGLSLGVLIIISLTIIGWVSRSSREMARIDEFRHFVFCTQITPGMSLSDVRTILSQYGKFRETKADFTSFISVSIYFTDLIPNRQFGGGSITLVFIDGKYADARVPVPMSDSYRSLCR